MKRLLIFLLIILLLASGKCEIIEDVQEEIAEEEIQIQDLEEENKQIAIEYEAYSQELVLFLEIEKQVEINYIYNIDQPLKLKGEEIVLTSSLIGFENYIIYYQWQCDKNDGNGFYDIEGANENYYIINIYPNMLYYKWRLKILYTKEDSCD